MMTPPSTYPAVCQRANELAEQNRFQEAFELHERYAEMAAVRGDKGYSSRYPCCGKRQSCGHAHDCPDVLDLEGETHDAV